ncbi:MAG: prenyltransferase/squalene oxidase repeat-containing protein [Methanosarcinales archaeon]
MDKITNTINNAKKWLYNHKTGSAWIFPVISECPVSTALSLYVVDEETKSKAIEYLMNIKVWEKNLFAAGVFFCALKKSGNLHLAEKVLNHCKNEIGKKKAPDKKSRVLHHQVTHKRIEGLLEELKVVFPLDIPEKEISKIPIYSILFKHTPARFWFKRTSYFHDFFPFIAPMLVNKINKKTNQKVINVLKKALNEDGSYGGITAPTILSIYLLQKFGEVDYAKKSLKWLEKVRNENGSFRPLYCQDVYDTAWVSLALSTLGEDVDDALQWLDSKKVDDGYPYVSSSYFPDPDDTSLVLLTKKNLNCMDTEDYKALDFLIKSQNPDGGWSYNTVYRGIIAITLKMLAIIVKGIGFLFTKNRRGYGFLASYHPPRNYMSTIDMTARVLITLAHFKENENVRNAIDRGIKYLLKHYSNGRFVAPHRWTFSDIYENSMALIALYKNGIKNEKTKNAMHWILNQKIEFAEDAAHVLWALVEGDHEKELADYFADIIASKQLPDGSWKHNVGFFLGSAKYYSLFSIASPLYALALYKNKFCVDNK